MTPLDFRDLSAERIAAALFAGVERRFTMIEKSNGSPVMSPRDWTITTETALRLNAYERGKDGAR